MRDAAHHGMRTWATLCALGAVSCAPHSSTPDGIADAVTRAVYANDLDGATADFDDETKAQISRSSLGELSDRMHALGELQSLAPRSSDPDRGRYEYDAHFTNGAMLVEVRIDPSGKVGAYRVAPEKSS